MKKLIILLMALPLCFTSCSNDDAVVGEETVAVSFCAELPQMMGTRVESTSNVNKVYCAVFENGSEIVRSEIDITPGQGISFVPRLIKGRTYRVAFWASKEDAYNVSNFNSITRNAGLSEAEYDAFTAVTDPITVEGSHTIEVTLRRPIAQLNMGVTEADWSCLTQQFGMTPSTITLTIEGKSAFNALTGSADGISQPITYDLNVTGAALVCNGVTYHNIAMCYVLASAENELVSINYSIYDQTETAIREDVSLINIPMQRNYKTNVVGGLLTGQVTYNITFDDSFLTDNDHNEEIN